MKITHSQSRTVQAKQYEPMNIMFSVESECEAKNVKKEMDKLQSIVDKKLAEAITDAKVSFKQEKENSNKPV